MQQEMFEEVINEMLTGKFCGICLAKMSYTDKTVETVFRKVSDIYSVGKERICCFY